MPLELLTSLGFFAGGVLLLLLGGDLLVKGAVALAERHGVPPITIGLTLMAFGTSAPELALNVAASLGGATALTFGNMTGSSLTNTGLVLGLAALVRPVKVCSSLLRRELPVLLGSVLLLLALSWLPGHPGVDGRPGLSRADGVVLLAVFLGFVGMMLRAAKQPAKVGATYAKDAKEVVRREPLLSWRLASALVVGGLVLLGLGGKLGEMGAVGAAQSLGMSQQLIGLTVVSLATTLPELITSLLAMRRGQTDMALGNIVGSNIFNLLFILGTASVIATVPLPEGGTLILLVLLGFTLLLFPLSISFDWTITRPEGLLVLALYLAFMAWQLWMGVSSAGF
ncbi:Inner membrane protein YrbG [Corallococcus coralloides]|uniref:Inner membrane protein YrbG n=1 Tax=Corallococcus coralloides TaxID=184914 RepID=A0A410RIY1_CORCK|nr:calcium/sodium antiporter [Corallococcus coralloides]QAT81813.1 Inner membrane protein YrbG [Corallococcus coralloides]